MTEVRNNTTDRYTLPPLEVVLRNAADERRREDGYVNGSRQKIPMSAFAAEQKPEFEPASDEQIKEFLSKQTKEFYTGKARAANGTPIVTGVRDMEMCRGALFDGQPPTHNPYMPRLINNTVLYLGCAAAVATLAMSNFVVPTYMVGAMWTLYSLIALQINSDKLYEFKDIIDLRRMGSERAHKEQTAPEKVRKFLFGGIRHRFSATWNFAKGRPVKANAFQAMSVAVMFGAAGPTGIIWSAGVEVALLGVRLANYVLYPMLTGKSANASSLRFGVRQEKIRQAQLRLGIDVDARRAAYNRSNKP